MMLGGTHMGHRTWVGAARSFAARVCESPLGPARRGGLRRHTIARGASAPPAKTQDRMAMRSTTQPHECANASGPRRFESLPAWRKACPTASHRAKRRKAIASHRSAIHRTACALLPKPAKATISQAETPPAYGAHPTILLTARALWSVAPAQRTAQHHATPLTQNKPCLPSSQSNPRPPAAVPLSPAAPWFAALYGVLKRFPGCGSAPLPCVLRRFPPAFSGVPFLHVSARPTAPHPAPRPASWLPTLSAFCCECSERCPPAPSPLAHRARAREWRLGRARAPGRWQTQNRAGGGEIDSARDCASVRDDARWCLRRSRVRAPSAATSWHTRRTLLAFAIPRLGALGARRALIGSGSAALAPQPHHRSAARAARQPRHHPTCSPLTRFILAPSRADSQHHDALPNFASSFGLAAAHLRRPICVLLRCPPPQEENFLPHGSGMSAGPLHAFTRVAKPEPHPRRTHVNAGHRERGRLPWYPKRKTFCPLKRNFCWVPPGIREGDEAPRPRPCDRAMRARPHHDHDRDQGHHRRTRHRATTTATTITTSSTTATSTATTTATTSSSSATTTTGRLGQTMRNTSTASAEFLLGPSRHSRG